MSATASSAVLSPTILPGKPPASVKIVATAPPAPAADDFVFELAGEGPAPPEAIEAWAGLLVHLVELEIEPAEVTV